MARLVFDNEGSAFFDIKLSRREGGYGAIAHLKVPKGIGRSSLVLHEEFFWREHPDECKAFIDGLAAGRRGVTILRNDCTFFSFWRKGSGRVLFEARSLIGPGEIAYRAEVSAEDVSRFHGMLDAICAGMLRMEQRKDGGNA